ncbi:MAG: DciA family protein [Ornithinimicrobium sp.]
MNSTPSDPHRSPPVEPASSPDDQAGSSPADVVGGGDAGEDLEAAHVALSRARAAAVARGYRPGRAGRRGPSTPGLIDRRGLAGSGSDSSEPRVLADEVDRLVASRGWLADVEVGAVVGRWSTIVGDHVAAHVEPVSFTGTVLTVRADSTAWATQVTLLAHSILARIETEIGAGLVTEIVVHGPAGPTWRKGALRVRGQGPRDTYG